MRNLDKKQSQPTAIVKINTMEMALDFYNETGLTISQDGKKYCTYLGNGRWAKNHKYYVQKQVLRRLHSKNRSISVKDLNKLFVDLKTICPVWSPAIPGAFVPVKNGYLSFQSGAVVLHPHASAFQFSYQLAAEFRPAADCPMFLKELHRYMHGYDIDLFQRYAGSLLLGRNTLRTVMVVIGHTGAGKDLLRSTLQYLAGHANSRGLEAKDWEGQLDHSELRGSPLLLTGDVRSNFFTPSGIDKLHTLVDGNVMNPAATKEANRITGDFHVLLQPHMIEKQPWSASLAEFRSRLLIVECEKPADDNGLKETGRSLWEKEASGILNWSVEGAILLQRDGSFQLNEQQRDRFYRFIMESKDPEPAIKPEKPSTSSNRLSKLWSKFFPNSKNEK